MERIVRERDMLREMETYDSILGETGKLACTLLVELDDQRERDLQLHAWRTLPEHVYLELPGGVLVRATVDESQRDAERISSVQYLKFQVDSEVPVAIGIDLHGISCAYSL